MKKKIAEWVRGGFPKETLREMRRSFGGIPCKLVFAGAAAQVVGLQTILCHPLVANDKFTDTVLTLLMLLMMVLQLLYGSNCFPYINTSQSKGLKHQYIGSAAPHRV